MAALSVLNPTLLDLAKQTAPDGSIDDIIEILNETNEILPDMTWQEGNLTTGHQSSIRTGLPTPTWRKIYGGIQPSKGTQVQVVDNTGMLEALSEVDAALVAKAKDPAKFRLNEDFAKIEGMNQEVADKLFYGNEGTAPEQITGLSPRFNSLSAANAENIIDAGGTGSDNGSIWLCVWHPLTGFGIVPQGSKAGLQIEDLGKQLVDAGTSGTANGRYLAFVTHYKWDLGLCIRDWRYFVRIANIDKSALTTDAATGANLPTLMFRAMRKIPNLALGRAAFYMSRDMATWLGEQTANITKQSTLTSDMVGGKFVERFKGIPVRRVDAISADEARVV